MENGSPENATLRGLMFSAEEHSVPRASPRVAPYLDNNDLNQSSMAPPPTETNHIETPATIPSVESWDTSGENHASLTADLSRQIWWDPNQQDSNASMNVMYGFEHLNDLEDIFAFTGSTLPPDPSVNLQTAYGQQIPNLVSQASPADVYYDRVMNLSSTDAFGIPHDDEDFLRSQGCFQLPPTQVFREMMLLYFRMVHPHLPIVIENEFWALWSSGSFSLGSSSLLVVRAMVYATCSVSGRNCRRKRWCSDNRIQLLSQETLSALGFHNKRDATIAYYRMAKV